MISKIMIQIKSNIKWKMKLLKKDLIKETKER
jgi:hypothetical protein